MDKITEIRIEEVKEFNIGHFIIAESVFIGLSEAIKNFKNLVRDNRKVL